MTIDIDVVPNNALLFISGDNTTVSFPVITETGKIADDFIDHNLLSGRLVNADEYAEVAEYYYFLNKELDRSLLLINKAIALKNESWYYKHRVDILERQGKFQDAFDCATLAITLDQDHKDWDERSMQKSEVEYIKGIDVFRDLLINKLST